MGGRPADGPGLHPTAVRTVSRPGSPPAGTDLAGRPQVRPGTRPYPGRIARFVRRYGWRAYAVPLLTLATVIALVDLALTHTDTASSVDAAPSVAMAEPSQVTVPGTAPAPAPPPAEADAGPSLDPQVVGAETYVEQGAGTVGVVDGSSQVYGSGPLRRFVVEVEDGIGVDGAAFAAAVEATLADARSWGNGGQMSFQRVGAPEAATSQYEFRVSLISPGSMERYCPGVGTGGYTSCRYGERAVINLARWATAVPHYDGDIANYRHYVVNHEVGHALGRGHVDCPGAGQVAPVMLQQTLGLDGCVKNAWPYP